MNLGASRRGSLSRSHPKTLPPSWWAERGPVRGGNSPKATQGSQLPGTAKIQQGALAPDPQRSPCLEAWAEASGLQAGISRAASSPAGLDGDKVQVAGVRAKPVQLPSAASRGCGRHVAVAGLRGPLPSSRGLRPPGADPWVRTQLTCSPAAQRKPREPHTRSGEARRRSAARGAGAPPSPSLRPSRGPAPPGGHALP